MSIADKALELFKNPLAFGILSGLVAGGIAAMRGKSIPIKANLIIAGVVSISEGVLSDHGFQTEIALKTGLGHILGMAPFTNFEALNAENRARLFQKLIEPSSFFIGPVHS